MRLLALVLVFAGAAPACSRESARVVEIDQLRAYPNPDGAGAVVFLRALNSTGKIRGLSDARAADPLRASIRTWAFEEGRQVTQPAETLWMPPGREVVLRGGGVHIHLEGFSSPPAPGKTVGFELGFNDGSWRSLTAEVEPLPSRK
ncbi:MAG: copper chaperone PCu(A)C [Myxococcota bacterium]